MAELVESVDAFVRGCYTHPTILLLLSAPEMNRLIPGVEIAPTPRVVQRPQQLYHNDDIAKNTRVMRPLYLPVTTREFD